MALLLLLLLSRIDESTFVVVPKDVVGVDDIPLAGSKNPKVALVRGRYLVLVNGKKVSTSADFAIRSIGVVVEFRERLQIVCATNISLAVHINDTRTVDFIDILPMAADRRQE